MYCFLWRLWFFTKR